MGWLRFLAKGMQKVGTSLFYVEELQPTWLPERLMRQYRGLYGVFIGLMIGVVFALSSVIDKGLMNVVVSGLRIGLVVGVGTLVIWITKNIPQLKLRILVAFLLMLGVDLLVGSGDSFFVLLVGCGGGIATWLTTDIYRSKLRALIGGLVIWLFGGLIGGVLSRLSVWLNNGLVLGQEIGIEQGLEFGVRLGLVGGLMLGLGVHISAGGLSSWVSGIQLRERVKLLWPSKQGFLYNTKWSSFYALIGGGVASLIIVWFARSLETALRISLLFMLLIGLSGILNAFLDIPPVDKRPNPGEGVRTSLRNALRMTLLGALLWGLPALVT
jgi:hypothetical protein